MVLRKNNITTVIVVIKCRNTVVDTSDSPVVANKEIGELAALDCRILLSGNRIAQELTTVDTVVCSCAISRTSIYRTKESLN